MEKNTYRSISILVLLLLILSVVVIAAGGGGGGEVQRTPKQEEPQLSPAEQCESYSTTNKRVTCRLQYGQIADSVPEACRGLTDSNRCQSLYRNSLSCYSKNGKDKDKCLREIAGFNGIITRDQNQESIRNYLVLLLYDLEEKVEDAYDDGKISEDNASYLITSIIEVKQKILENKPASEIRSSIQTLKSIWREVMG